MKKVLIAGGSGLVGSRLSQMLQEKGYEVSWLSRSSQRNIPYKVFQWDVRAQQIDKKALEDIDFVINLAGAGIADKPWTEQRKKLIIDSRVDSTELLLKTIREVKPTLNAYLASAAIGYYGDRGNELLKESDPPGKDGFLVESTLLWEKAIQSVKNAGYRTVAFRISIVLSTHGGALPKMAMPASFLLGTYFGDGQQWYSWIHIDDLCRMFIWAMENENLDGFYNAASPNPYTSEAFSAAIGKAKNRPTLNLPAPEFALRLFLGEMADTVLSSAKVSPEKIIRTGFEFQFPELVPALRDLFQRRV